MIHLPSSKSGDCKKLREILRKYSFGSYVRIMEVLIFQIPCCSIPVKYLLPYKYPGQFWCQFGCYKLRQWMSELIRYNFGSAIFLLFSNFRHLWWSSQDSRLYYIKILYRKSLTIKMWIIYSLTIRRTDI